MAVFQVRRFWNCRKGKRFTYCSRHSFVVPLKGYSLFCGFAVFLLLWGLFCVALGRGLWGQRSVVIFMFPWCFGWPCVRSLWLYSCCFSYECRGFITIPALLPRPCCWCTLASSLNLCFVPRFCSANYLRGVIFVVGAV